MQWAIWAVLGVATSAAMYWTDHMRLYPVHKSGAVLVTGASSGIGECSAIHVYKLARCSHIAVACGNVAMRFIFAHIHPRGNTLQVTVAHDHALR